jgi:hypothetical protein|tara:strand:+ start:172 stop:348 length:177 start_codon:yes stop_codon:yes gene_type:complete
MEIMEKSENKIPYSRITRVEVIGDEGREYVKHDLEMVEISTQDDGRTLKIFVSRKEKK